MTLNNWIQLVFNLLVLALVFPIYIILKTKRYLPKLWDDNALVIVQNNDFYAVRLNQVSPGGQERAETSL